jgi:hypothetical protein
MNIPIVTITSAAILLIASIFAIIEFFIIYKKQRKIGTIFIIISIAGISFGNLGCFIRSFSPVEYTFPFLAFSVSAVAVGLFFGSLFCILYLPPKYNKFKFLVAIPFIFAFIIVVEELTTPYNLVEIEAGAKEIVHLMEEAIIPKAIYFTSVIILSLLPGLFFAAYSIMIEGKINKINGCILSLGFFVLFIFGIVESIGTGTCLTRIAIAIGAILIYLSYPLPTKLIRLISH